MTLNVVSCLLHLHVKGRLLDHVVPLSKDEGINFMVELLGSDMVEAQFQVKAIKFTQTRVSQLRKNFKLRLEATTANEEDGDVYEMRLNRDHVVLGGYYALH